MKVRFHSTLDNRINRYYLFSMRSRVTKNADLNRCGSPREPEPQPDSDHAPFIPVKKSTSPILYKAKYLNTKSKLMRYGKKGMRKR